MGFFINVFYRNKTMRLDLYLPGVANSGMALVNIDTALGDVLKRLRKLNSPAGVEVLSYKRNRGISIVLNSDGTARIRERGYVEQELDVPLGELTKILKPMFRTEFPRSRKVRVYQISGPGEADMERKRL